MRDARSGGQDWLDGFDPRGVVRDAAPDRSGRRAHDRGALTGASTLGGRILRAARAAALLHHEAELSADHAGLAADGAADRSTEGVTVAERFALLDLPASGRVPSESDR